jgi:hypothetical protein
MFVNVVSLFRFIMCIGSLDYAVYLVLFVLHHDIILSNTNGKWQTLLNCKFLVRGH